MSAPFLYVDLEVETPAYVQIEEQIRAAIERGALGPDAALPTVRQLAGDLGLAPNTVARAYADLIADGLLVAEGRRGTRVAAGVRPAGARARRSALRARVKRFVASLSARGFSSEEIGEALRQLG